MTIDLVVPSGQKLHLYLMDDQGGLHKVSLTSEEASKVQVLHQDGRAASARVLAGMWTCWMSASATNASTTLLASSTLQPYAHQSNAVYGAMVPQPYLRFLLADEPGTGKTIMAGMYIREMQRLGLIRRALIVCPANLVSKWQADFGRFFGGGLRRVTADSVREHALDTNHDMWVVSLELAAVNGAVQDAIRPDRAGWDVVVFDEAHRLTPTATGFHQVARLLAKYSPRALLMTATPHRGSEWLFRHLLHLVDPDIYPDPGPKEDRTLDSLRPGPIHFLRRMKEDLVDYDGVTHLFRGRTAQNFAIPLSAKEYGIYTQALDMVEAYFSPSARPLARMVYGKRAASSLFALQQTLKRRATHMGEKTEAEAALEAEQEFDSDDAAREEAQVVHGVSSSSKAERTAIRDLLAQIERAITDARWVPSKWADLTEKCLKANGVAPGNHEQAVVFTEYADSAEWLMRGLAREGYTARMYSGRQSNHERDSIRDAFMRGDYQIIVTTDAGNEGIDLQAAQILINYDIPWSLVRLEQRMGRIHRVGQTKDVHLYNLIAVDTREGNTLHRLLENFVSAANELNGQMFDSLSAVAEISGVHYEQWLTDLYGNDETKKERALTAVAKVKASDLKRSAQIARAQESALASQVDAMAALALLQGDLLERINPAIVESYLGRLEQAELLTKQATSLGDGILLLSSAFGFPASLGGGNRLLVASSGDALLAAKMANIDTTNVLPLGPGEQAFDELINHAASSFEPDLYRSGAAIDPTSVTAYELFAFEATLSEAGGKKSSAWAALIRVDETGDARPVRWETLANLMPTELVGTKAHPAHQDAATSAAKDLAHNTAENQQRVRSEWFSRARNDLRSLPIDLTVGIEDRDERLSLRSKLSEQTARRLTELQKLSQVTLEDPLPVGRISVYPAAPPKTVEQKDSEIIAMRHVRRVLENDGWKVADVHTEGRGYDMRAIRAAEQRFVEIKGVWQSAASEGIRMTGNEVLMAAQYRKGYWLYIIDQCNDAEGRLFGAFRDPVVTFSDEMSGEAIFRVSGSSLLKARNIPNLENS